MPADKSVRPHARMASDHRVMPDGGAFGGIKVIPDFCQRADESARADDRAVAQFRVRADRGGWMNQAGALISRLPHPFESLPAEFRFADGNHKACVFRAVTFAERMETEDRTSQQTVRRGMIINKDRFRPLSGLIRHILEFPAHRASSV